MQRTDLQSNLMTNVEMKEIHILSAVVPYKQYSNESKTFT